MEFFFIVNVYSLLHNYHVHALHSRFRRVSSIYLRSSVVASVLEDRYPLLVAVYSFQSASLFLCNSSYYVFTSYYFSLNCHGLYILKTLREFPVPVLALLYCKLTCQTVFSFCSAQCHYN